MRLPGGGVCVHIVAACVWARSSVDSSPLIEPVGITGQAPGDDPLAELLALDPAKVNRAAGVPLSAGWSRDRSDADVIWPGPGSVRIAGRTHPR